MTTSTEIDEARLQGLAANCGHAYLAGARATGRPWLEEDDLVMSDLGLPIPLSANNATLLRPVTDPAGAAGVAARTDAFFSGPGGGYQVWSLWPDLDLAPFGLSRSAAPCMVREPGGAGRSSPPELEVVEVRDDGAMHEVWGVIDEVFGRGRTPEPLWDARVLSDDYRVWLGLVEGRAVATATASVSHGFVGVYVVATRPEARGRGYGEAVTWAATLCRPDLPATLQASDMGRPVYERMGYRTVADFTVWVRPERSPRL
ncbi:MAG TPA: GNAT family N-acetyltransferase [Actinomycetota bacterium]|nr:GNAT family N-acetyltransferase [Actinomycetota bacterium]